MGFQSPNKVGGCLRVEWMSVRYYTLSEVTVVCILVQELPSRVSTRGMCGCGSEGLVSIGSE